MTIPVPGIAQYKADRERPSPNHGARSAAGIRLIILHATADTGRESEEGSIAWMRNPQSKASAHLMIHRSGDVTRLVDDTRRAWHAGVSSWPGVGDVNGESLGWELSNTNRGEPFAAAQYERVAELCNWYMPQGIVRADVLGHYHVSPGRKTDPLGWDWDRLWSLVYPAAAPTIVHPLGEPWPGPPDEPVVTPPTPAPLPVPARIWARVRAWIGKP